MIKEFQGEYRWLSNFAKVPIELDGVVYPSVEHAYMSAKSDNKYWKIFCSNPNNKPGLVKRESRKIVVVSGWEAMKVSVMEECVYKKFSQEPYKTKLIKTQDKHIQEGNNWGDKFWGVCLKTGEGENNLGKIIMNIRDRIISKTML